MKCDFDICEFYNVFFGGILTGIITSFVFVWLTDFIIKYKFKKRYGHFQSYSTDNFDWTAYSMKEDDGRIRQDNPNGSVLNIKVQTDKLLLALKQSDGELWSGELVVNGTDHGLVTYKYDTRHEYGQRECSFGTYIENGQIIDYLFLTPINNKIYYIKKIDPDKQTVVYNYGDEIFIRRRASR